MTAPGFLRTRGKTGLPMPATPGHPTGNRLLIKFFEHLELTDEQTRAPAVRQHEKATGRRLQRRHCDRVSLG
jgi:hypothetical protein